MKYIHQISDWPNFYWDEKKISSLLAEVRHQQGRLLGRMESLGFDLRMEANLHTLTLEVVKSSEIEGETLNPDQVRSSIARKLGLDIAGLVPSERNIDGVVEMMIDATQKYKNELSKQRLFGWHASLFPTGYSGILKVTVGEWRQMEGEPMQVVSGPMGKEKVHFEAPAANKIEYEMDLFLKWFNSNNNLDPVLKAAIAHLWFVTIHPFDDGNGRITRAIGEMQLTRSDGNAQRFYSMSAQIRKERTAYYEILEITQKSSLDISAWIQWFLHCLNHAFTSTDETLEAVFHKSKFWNQHADTEFNPRQKFMIDKLLEDFFGKLNTSKWARMTNTSNDTALRDIQYLMKKGILTQEEFGGRSTSYALKLP